jgi:hypothetical protein
MTDALSHGINPSILPPELQVTEKEGGTGVRGITWLLAGPGSVAWHRHRRLLLLTPTVGTWCFLSVDRSVGSCLS